MAPAATLATRTSLKTIESAIVSSTRGWDGWLVGACAEGCPRTRHDVLRKQRLKPGRLHAHCEADLQRTARQHCMV
eukprot:364258-Chlamydomonas_euryale.AAC.12